MTDDDGAPDAAANHVEDAGATRALENLLRDERAAVAVTVALASGATTYRDRARLEPIGGELVVLTCALRERLDLAGSFVPPGSSYDAQAMLAVASYDARLAALADFLDASAGRATAALAISADGELARTLRDLIAAHAAAAEWLRRRAAAFAASRPDGDPSDGSGLEAHDAHTEDATQGTDAQLARDPSRADGDGPP